MGSAVRIFAYVVILPAEKKLDTHSRPGDGYSQIVARVVSWKRLNNTSCPCHSRASGNPLYRYYNDTTLACF